jgi:Mrp family chromosome partitioning ATPase
VTDERRGQGNRPGEEYAEAEMTLPNAARRETQRRPTPTSKGLPPPPVGMPLPPSAPTPVPVVPERSGRTAATGPLTQMVKTESVMRDAEIARQAAHAAAQLAQRTQVTTEGPVVRNTTVFHKAALGLDSSELVRVYRLPPTRRLDPRLFMLGAPDSPAAANFRVLRHRLSERKGLKVLLVTSAGAGEGKTLCAVNLALALSEAGRARVLLLEANFRSPSLARLFGFQPPVCIGDQMETQRSRAPQQWVVVETGSPWLHTAAVAPDTASRPILDGPALGNCIDELRGAGYDYIVVDSPPILGSADVNLIEENVDGILVVMWARKSHARALRKGVDQIGKSKLLGIVLLGG